MNTDLPFHDVLSDDALSDKAARQDAACLAVRCPPDVFSRLTSAFVAALGETLRAGDTTRLAGMLDRAVAEGLSLETHIAWEGTPLMVAARSGRLEAARLLLERGAGVNTFIEDGSTALREAACAGQYATACLLMDHGADLDKVGNHQTPLTAAVIADCLPLVQELCRRGADLKAAEKGRDAPLFLALNKGFWPIVRWLVQARANETGRSRWGATPLIAAVEGGATREQAAWLLDDGEDARACRLLYAAETALHIAASKGNAPVAALLLERGADSGAGDYKGRTPLHYAAEHGHVDLLRALLASGANVNARDNDGRAALFDAVQWGQAEAAQTLLESGADCEAADSGGITALLRAADSAFYPVKQDALTGVARLLMERKADSNVVSRKGITPLHAALQNRESDLVRLLLQCGANVAWAETVSKTGLLPLAVPLQDVELLRLLLDAGAVVDGRDKMGRTALMIATYQNDKPLMTLLLERGADPNATTPIGKSVLDFATKSKRERVTLAALLRDAGARSKQSQGTVPM